MCIYVFFLIIKAKIQLNCWLFKNETDFLYQIFTIKKKKKAAFSTGLGKIALWILKVVGHLVDLGVNFVLLE